MYFVIQKKHVAEGNWDNNVFTHATEDEAKHRFHAFMSTYAYGQSATMDYVACTIETDDGRVIKNEIDDRRTGA